MEYQLVMVPEKNIKMVFWNVMMKRLEGIITTITSIAYLCQKDCLLTMTINALKCLLKPQAKDV